MKGSTAKDNSCLPRTRYCTFSASDRDDREWFCRTSGAVNARRSCWETFASVNDTLPDGSNRRDHGEMMNPRAVGSAVFEKKKTTLKSKQRCLMPLMLFYLLKDTFNISLHIINGIDSYFLFHLWCFITMTTASILITLRSNTYLSWLFFAIIHTSKLRKSR